MHPPVLFYGKVHDIELPVFYRKILVFFSVYLHKSRE